MMSKCNKLYRYAYKANVICTLGFHVGNSCHAIEFKLISLTKLDSIQGQTKLSLNYLIL